MTEKNYYGVDTDRFIARVIVQEAVILDAQTGYCYSLNKTATVIWSALMAGHSLEAVMTHLRISYGLSEEQSKKDLETFIAAMVQKKLLTKAEAPAAPLPILEESKTTEAYQIPDFEEYDEIKRGRSVA